MRQKLELAKEILKNPKKVNALKIFKDYTFNKSNMLLKELYDELFDNGAKILASVELAMDTYDLVMVRVAAHKRDLESYRGTSIETVIRSFADTKEEDLLAAQRLEKALKEDEDEDMEPAYGSQIADVLKDKIHAWRKQRNVILAKREVSEQDLAEIENLENKINNTRNILQMYLTATEA
jgi:hypothetical protein